MTTRSRIAGCGERGHVGATYNPWRDLTWCLCGERSYPGDVATHDDCCHDAPAGPPANTGDCRDDHEAVRAAAAAFIADEGGA